VYYIIDDIVFSSWAEFCDQRHKKLRDINYFQNHTIIIKLPEIGWYE